jgi:hypothetical protein
VPRGWPPAVAQPGSEGRETSAAAWLLDLLPRYRQYPAMRQLMQTTGMVSLTSEWRPHRRIFCHADTEVAYCSRGVSAVGSTVVQLVLAVLAQRIPEFLMCQMEAPEALELETWLDRVELADEHGTPARVTSHQFRHSGHPG